MNSELLKKITSVYGIGSLQSRPQKITGGRLHYLWKIKTEQGYFVLKELNPYLMARSRYCEKYVQTEHIARAMLAKSVPARAALVQNDLPYCYVDKAYYMLFNWIEGREITVEELGINQAQQMGNILAKIHTSELHLPASRPDEFYFSATHWWALAAKAAKRQFPEATILQTLLPDLIETNALSVAANQSLSQCWVISHRDLDTRNVLWKTSSSPIVIDWESAGWVNPTMDLLGSAMAFSISERTRMIWDLFKAVILGYRSVSSTVLGNFKDAFYGVMGVWLGWLEYNLRRYLGECTKDRDEQRLGAWEAMNTLLSFQFIMTIKEKVIETMAELCFT